MDGSEESFVPEALFYMKDRPASVFFLKLFRPFSSPYYPWEWYVSLYFYVHHTNRPNIGKYSIHGWYGFGDGFKKKTCSCKKKLVGFASQLQGV